MSDKKFVRDLKSVLEDIVVSATDVVREDDITINKVMRAASAQGKPMGAGMAARLIKKRVEAGLLRHDGKRIDPDSKKVVNVWVVVK